MVPILFDVIKPAFSLKLELGQTICNKRQVLRVDRDIERVRLCQVPPREILASLILGTNAEAPKKCRKKMNRASKQYENHHPGTRAQLQISTTRNDARK